MNYIEELEGLLWEVKTDMPEQKYIDLMNVLGKASEAKSLKPYYKHKVKVVLETNIKIAPYEWGQLTDQEYNSENDDDSIAMEEPEVKTITTSSRKTCNLLEKITLVNDFSIDTEELITRVLYREGRVSLSAFSIGDSPVQLTHQEKLNAVITKLIKEDKKYYISSSDIYIEYIKSI